MKRRAPKIAGFLWLIAFMVAGCGTETPQPKSYVLTIIIGENGTVSPIGGSFKEGTAVNLTATAAPGYRIYSWKGTDNDASTATTNAVTMTGNKTVEVAFTSQVNENFERADAATNWVFGNGPEFPGATGNFTVVADRGRSNSKGGVLAFDFTGGGNYVIASQTFSGPVQLKGISFWISGFVPGTRLLVRLTDESGQIFQYFPTVPAGAGAGWARILVLLGDWDSSWGGSADGVFHGGLKACGIGIEKGVQYHKTGEIVIDDITEMTTVEITFDPFGQDRLPGFYSGSISALIGVNIHFIRPVANLLDLAKNAGFGFVRMDLFWPTVETNVSHYDFSEYDLLVQALEDRGLGALLILDYGNPLYYDGPGGFNDKWGPQTAATRDAYAGFALAAARHYTGRQVMLEVWNEPNIAQFWAPAPDPANYGLLVDKTFRAVKSQIANIPIIIGATSGCDAAFLDRVFDVPGLTNIEAVSIHPYRSSAPELFVQERILVQDVIKHKTGRSNVPLYSGEWGYSSTLFGGRNDAAWKKQAAYAIRLILINILSGVPKTVWYDLKDDGPNPSDPEHNFGLLNENSAAKPAFKAVKTLTDLLPGRESGDLSVNSWTVSAVDTRANAIYGLVFQNERGRLASLWTSHARGSVEVKIPDSTSFQFFNMFGESVTPSKRENGFCVLSLDGENGPVYVKSSTNNGMDGMSIIASTPKDGGYSRTDRSSGYSGRTITISNPTVSNSPQIDNVGLHIKSVGTDSPPFGDYATPLDGSTVTSSIPVTGWVLDDIGIQSVKIYRGTGLSDRVYIGDAVFPKGARPDVEAAYPGYPQNDRAGWGYMLLTNFLPNGGNGPFQLLAYATDTGGQEVLLGSKMITCDNLHAAKSFGTIDTPGQGGMASGSSYINFGWALTPQPNSIPIDGSSLTVFVDGLPLGHPAYNGYRSDIATLFPGYANSNGAEGYYPLNTTGYADGVHTIAWLVTDSGGNADGIGSRYFTIQNVAGRLGLNGSEAENIRGTGSKENALKSVELQQNIGIRSAAEIAGIPEDIRTPVYLKHGYTDDQSTETVFPETDGSIRIQIPEVSRVSIYLREKDTRESKVEREARSRWILFDSPAEAFAGSRYEAYELVLGELRPLPIGSSFDSRDGVLYWQPGPGFLGNYDFIFVDGYQNTKKAIKIRIGPK